MSNPSNHSGPHRSRAWKARNADGDWSLKRLVIILSIAGVLGGLARTGHFNLGADAEWADTASPVYAVLRFKADLHDRSLQAVALARAADVVDCRHGSNELVAKVQHNQDDGAVTVWKLQSSECTTTLDARSLELFDNKPNVVNYLSAARGASSERELRIVVWGAKGDEDDRICDEVPIIQKDWQGAVTCVRAIRSP